MIEITLDVLRDHEACGPGEDWFAKAFPAGLRVREWTPAHQAFLLGDPKGRKWWAWAVLEKLIPAHPMRGWNFRGKDFRWADLRWADFTGSDLRGAVLVGAFLRGADLAGADLAGANLRGAIGLTYAQREDFATRGALV
jgi:hypothetical protein